MANEDIRKSAKENHVKLWKIAEELGINDGNFSRRLRCELPDTEKQKIFSIIQKISKEEN